MRPEISAELDSLDTTLTTIEKVMDPEEMSARVRELEQQASDPSLWDNPDHAQTVTSELSAVQGKLRKVTDLRQRLDNQHARHHRLLRKMTRKKILAVRHTFIPNAEFARLKIFYVIHQQKRMSVWNNLLNLFRCQTVHSLLPFSSRLYAFTRNSGFP